MHASKLARNVLLSKVEAVHPQPSSGEETPWDHGPFPNQRPRPSWAPVYDEVNTSVVAMAQEGAPEEVRARASLVVLGIVLQGRREEG